MYWTPAKMLLLADVDEYNFANADKGSVMRTMSWRHHDSIPQNLSYNGLRGPGAAMICTALRKNPNIRCLELAGKQ